MIQAPALLKELNAFFPRLETDIRQRLEEMPAEEGSLRVAYQEARAGQRTIPGGAGGPADWGGLGGLAG